LHSLKLDFSPLFGNHKCVCFGLERVNSQWPAVEIEMSLVFGAETPEQVFLWELGFSTIEHL
jgi:hypothetical protein